MARSKHKLDIIKQNGVTYARISDLFEAGYLEELAIVRPLPNNQATVDCKLNEINRALTDITSCAKKLRVGILKSLNHEGFQQIGRLKMNDEGEVVVDMCYGAEIVELPSRTQETAGEGAQIITQPVESNENEHVKMKYDFSGDPSLYDASPYLRPNLRPDLAQLAVEHADEPSLLGEPAIDGSTAVESGQPAYTNPPPSQQMSLASFGPSSFSIQAPLQFGNTSALHHLTSTDLNSSLLNHPFSAGISSNTLFRIAVKSGLAGNSDCVDTIKKLIETGSPAKFFFDNAVEERAKEMAQESNKGIEARIRSAVASARLACEKETVKRLDAQQLEHKKDKKVLAVLLEEESKKKRDVEEKLVKEKRELEKRIRGLLKEQENTDRPLVSLAWNLIRKYQDKNQQILNLLWEHDLGVREMYSGQVLRILSADNIVGKEYKSLCEEALTKYKSELKKQYKTHLDAIEMENREWLRTNATGLTGDKLEELFFTLWAAREYDPALPEVNSNVVEKLMPGSANLLENTEAEVLEGDADIRALAEKSRIINTRLKKLEEDRNHKLELQAAAKATPPSPPSPMARAQQTSKHLNASTPANYGGGFWLGDAEETFTFGAGYSSPYGLTSQGANTDTDGLPESNDERLDALIEARHFTATGANDTPLASRTVTGVLRSGNRLTFPSLDEGVNAGRGFPEGVPTGPKGKGKRSRRPPKRLRQANISAEDSQAAKKQRLLGGLGL